MHPATPHSRPDDSRRFAAWFAGPKAENADRFVAMLRRIAEDYYAWRRNYFPEDGVVIDSVLRRENEPFHDAFEDRLIELLGRLKADFPFHSPRYAAHMLSEQTLPSVAGYFAAMLYNPNNVTSEAAPVTVRLEHEASRLLARMVGYTSDAWSHITSGGTIANLEALWMARTVRYLPFAVNDMRRALSLPPAPWRTDERTLLGVAPMTALEAFSRVFDDASAHAPGDAITRRVVRAYLDSPFCIVEAGIANVLSRLSSRPAVLVPETHHYCFEKAMDVLGLGRESLIHVPVDHDFRMDARALEAALDRLDTEHRHALAVVAVVGTTEEGAVDPVDKVLSLRAARERAGKGSFWLHADGAYGGYLRTLTIPHRLGLGEPRASVRVRGIERSLPIHLPEHAACDALERLGEADSVTIDPHKLGYVPYPAGVICFRSSVVKALARQDAPYLTDSPGDVAAERRSTGIGVYILEGSKPGAAAAGVWLSHTLIPLDATGHGLLIKDTIRSACELHALLERFHEFDPTCTIRAVPLCAPGSNIVCFAFAPAAGGMTLEQINALNRRVHERFSVGEGESVHDQTFFVSRTTLSPAQYALPTVAPFLARLGVRPDEYAAHGVFLLRSVLMNPWHTLAKHRGRHFLSELAEELHRVAGEECAAHERR
jgi:glutamate/tyrosine decarboxylase-like PLP-dependent enzyme